MSEVHSSSAILMNHNDIYSWKSKFVKLCPNAHTETHAHSMHPMSFRFVLFSRVKFFGEIFPIRLLPGNTNVTEYVKRAKVLVCVFVQIYHYIWLDFDFLAYLNFSFRPACFIFGFSLFNFSMQLYNLFISLLHSLRKTHIVRLKNAANSNALLQN